MQQPQYYKTVRASERLPDKEDTYYVKYTTGELEVLYASGVHHEKRWKALVDEWLEPIPIPDVDRLREALEKIAYKTGGSDDYVDMDVNTIAREALSNTSDGWVRVGSAMFPDNDSEMWWAYWESSGAIYPASIRHCEPVHYSNQVPISPKPTHMKKATLPAPPQPINP